MALLLVWWFFSSVSISVASPFDAFTIVYIGMGLMLERQELSWAKEARGAGIEAV